MPYNEAWNSLSAWYDGWFPVEESESEGEGIDEEEDEGESEGEE